MSPWFLPTPDMIERWKADNDVEKLIDSLLMPNNPHRLLVLRAIEDLGEKTIPHLIRIVEKNRSNSELMLYAIDLLALLRAESAVNILTSLIEEDPYGDTELDEGRQVWIASVDALGRIATPDALDYLKELTKSHRLSDENRIRVVEALSVSTVQNLPEHLLELWQIFKTQGMRRAIIAGLIGQGSATLDMVMKMYQEAETEAVKKLIIEEVGDLQKEAFVPFLVDIVKNYTGELANIAIRSLGEIADTRAYVPVKDAIPKLDEDGQILAAKTLVKLGWKPNDAESEDIWTLYYCASNRLHRALGLGDTGLRRVYRFLEFDPFGLITYSLDPPDFSIWKKTIDTLIDSLYEESVNRAFVNLMEYKGSYSLQVGEYLTEVYPKIMNVR